MRRGARSRRRFPWRSPILNMKEFCSGRIFTFVLIVNGQFLDAIARERRNLTPIRRTPGPVLQSVRPGSRPVYATPRGQGVPYGIFRAALCAHVLPVEVHVDQVKRALTLLLAGF